MTGAVDGFPSFMEAAEAIDPWLVFNFESGEGKGYVFRKITS